MIQIDMEKPKFCWWMDGNDYRKCPMVDGKNGCCLHSNVSYATWEEQHKHCPLHEVTDIHTGYVGVDDDYPVSVKQVLNITAELGALETQSRVRELPRYQVTDPDTVSRQAVIEINRSYHGQMPNEVNHRIWKEINELPPAEPEKRTEERTETHACDLIDRQAAIDTLDKHLRTTDVPVSYPGIISALTEWLNEVPSAQPVSKELSSTHKALDTISRQAAIEAVEFGITYAKAINKSTGEVKELFKEGNKALNEAVERIKDLPSAQPDLSEYSDKLWKAAYERDKAEALDEIVRCKDCKHWKDSDGVYRRGIGAESKCPVNIRAVYEGNFYCADAERRTDERQT